jgi:hypothetical protein
MELFGTMGKEAQLVPGKELTLLEQGGAGTLTHLWFGGSWPGWGDTRIRVYVDGEPLRFAAYRVHEDDPIPFRSGLRLVWRNGKELRGHRFGDPKATTLTSYAWAYEW